MKDKHSKKVIIINDINSDAIERAILILREGKCFVPSPAAGSHIVEEAGAVIRSYIRTMDKAQDEMDRRERKSRQPKSFAAHLPTLLSVLAGVAVLGCIILHLCGVTP